MKIYAIPSELEGTLVHNSHILPLFLHLRNLKNPRIGWKILHQCILLANEITIFFQRFFSGDLRSFTSDIHPSWSQLAIWWGPQVRGTNESPHTPCEAIRRPHGQSRRGLAMSSPSWINMNIGKCIYILYVYIVYNTCIINIYNVYNTYIIYIMCIIHIYIYIIYKCRNMGNIRNSLHSFGSTILMIHSVQRPLPRARPKSHSLALSHAVTQASELWIWGSWIFLASKCQFWISQAAWYRNSSWPERMLVKKDQLDTYYSVSWSVLHGNPRQMCIC